MEQNKIKVIDLGAIREDDDDYEEVDVDDENQNAHNTTAAFNESFFNFDEYSEISFIKTVTVNIDQDNGNDNYY